MNILLSAPTGSGKTAVMELAICRLLHGNVTMLSEARGGGGGGAVDGSSSAAASAAGRPAEGFRPPNGSLKTIFIAPTKGKTTPHHHRSFLSVYT